MHPNPKEEGAKDCKRSLQGAWEVRQTDRESTKKWKAREGPPLQSPLGTVEAVSMEARMEPKGHAEKPPTVSQKVVEKETSAERARTQAGPRLWEQEGDFLSSQAVL